MLTPEQEAAVDRAAADAVSILCRSVTPDGCDIETYLLTLAAVARRVELVAAAETASAVRELRRHQVSWERIARAVRMTKQAASTKRAWQPRASRVPASVG